MRRFHQKNGRPDRYRVVTATNSFHGRKMHTMYLFQVKSPAESKGRNDIYKLISAIPPEQAFRPLAEGDCPLVKK